MIICPWCGTSYLVFQSNCTNCGGPLPALEEKTASASKTETLPVPPPAPRPIPKRYVWRLLSSDGWWIGALVFGFIGVIFSLVGTGLTVGVITAFVGIPFLLLGVAFLGAGIWVFLWRYQNAQKVVNVLRKGEATRGQIVEIQENLSETINGRHPWVIRYQFQVNGEDEEGKVSIMNQPGGELQAGKAVCVLYLPSAPKWSSIYPHP